MGKYVKKSAYHGKYIKPVNRGWTLGKAAARLAGGFGGWVSGGGAKWGARKAGRFTKQLFRRGSGPYIRSGYSKSAYNRNTGSNRGPRLGSNTGKRGGGFNGMNVSSQFRRASKSKKY